MGAVVADTHTAVWYLLEDPELSAAAEAALDEATQAGDPIWVSSISLIEVIYLVEKRRLVPAVLESLNQVLADSNSGFVLVPLGAEIARVGRDYGRGDGTRLLILGESHYGERTEGPEFTIRLTSEYAEGKWNHRFWTNIMQVVAGRPSREIERPVFWGSIALYNYIQEIVADRPGVAPTDAMWAKADRPFMQVLDQLCPTHILGLSTRLWVHLPPGEKGPVLQLEGQERETRIYRAARRSSLATWIPHPSYFFSFRYWRPWVCQFLDLSPTLKEGRFADSIQ